jgi:hypothetical protein
MSISCQNFKGCTQITESLKMANAWRNMLHTSQSLSREHVAWWKSCVFLSTFWNIGKCFQIRNFTNKRTGTAVFHSVAHKNTPPFTHSMQVKNSCYRRRSVTWSVEARNTANPTSEESDGFSDVFSWGETTRRRCLSRVLVTRDVSKAVSVGVSFYHAVWCSSRSSVVWRTHEPV